MHELLKPFAVDGMNYIERAELMRMLADHDGPYFFDDLVFLNVAADCLCGYLPDTDPKRNFCYYRVVRSGIDGKGRRVEDYAIISCRDPDILERYLDFYYNNRIIRRFSVNVPAKFESASEDSDKTVKALLEKYGGYYKISEERPPIHDYRFPDPDNITATAESGAYQVKNQATNKARSDHEKFKRFIWILYKDGKPLIEEFINPYFEQELGPYPYCVDVGVKAISFGDTEYLREGVKIETEEYAFIRRYIASVFAKEGYIIKSIATGNEDDTDEIYEQMGMEKYRSFILLETEEQTKKDDFI